MTALWTIAVTCAAGSAALLARAAESIPWAWALAAGACLLAPGLVSSAWFGVGVRAWNAAARRSSNAIRLYVLGVCYYMLIVPLGAAEGRRGPLCLAKGQAGWISRVPEDAEARRMWPPSGWHRTVSTYALSSPQRQWAVVLVPILWLLRVLGDERHDIVPSRSSYTLY
jgi:hypothetical protein